MQDNEKLNKEDIWVQIPTQPGRYLMRNAFNHKDLSGIIVEYVTWIKYASSKDGSIFGDLWRIESFDKSERNEFFEDISPTKKQFLTVVKVLYNNQFIENNTPLETYHMYGEFNGYYGEYKLIEG